MPVGRAPAITLPHLDLQWAVRVITIDPIEEGEDLGVIIM